MRTRVVPSLTALILMLGVWGCSGSDQGDGGKGGSSSSSGGKPVDAGKPLPPCGLDDGVQCALDSGISYAICCGGVCTDTQTDSANCQGCGHNCPSGSTCVAGLCETPENVIATCDDEPDGGCGPSLACALEPTALNPYGLPGYWCVPQTCGGGTPGGACILPYDTLGICCDGGCFENQSGCIHPVPWTDAGFPSQRDGGVDAGDGGERHECDGGPDGGCEEETDGGLDAGADAGFDAGFTVSCGKIDGEGCPLDAGDGVCCEGACVDPQTDIADCGGCGRNCPVGASCSGGSCVASKVGCGDGGSCGPGLVCVGSQICLSTACEAGETGAECALLPQGTIGTCQDGVCTAPQKDAGVQTDGGSGDGGHGDGGHDAGPDAG
jgi:hypothetical protein